jgi:pyruvate kinase
MSAESERQRLLGLHEELVRLRGELFDAEETAGDRLAGVGLVERGSARNLLHYLALRRQDIRPLQHELALRGLSSLGRSESHVLASVESVLGVVERLVAHPRDTSTGDASEGEALLVERTERLLGPTPEGRDVRIMVTLPSEAADSPALVRSMVALGMDCARVNTAHDDPEAWCRMAANVRSAAEELGRPCLVQLDLAGPKLRTGPVAPRPAVTKLRPHRDPYGRVVAPAAGRLGSGGVRVDPVWLARLSPGDAVRLRDTRGARRRLTVTGVDDGGADVVSTHTVYLAPGVTLEHDGGKTTVLGVPLREGWLALDIGDRLVLTRDQRPGEGAGPHGPARVPCTLVEAFTLVRPGERILFDDGRIGGVVEEVSADEIVVAVDHAPEGGARLRAGKGINLPDSDLGIPALTDDDLRVLPLVAELADIVALSFVSSPQDVVELAGRLDALGAGGRGIVLKIETRRAFERLPDLLLTAIAGRGPFGMMIARGDLAVECGWERLAEVQEEILWLCEAAHAPVIWATQVLESLAKTGLPSRAEITDAAMGIRAECVMLNKGPNVREAIRTLDDILRRMASHQHKKTALLRRLRAWEEGPAPAGAGAVSGVRD